MNSLSGKKILVTGGAGFIGSHLVGRLREVDGVKLILLSRRLVSNKAEKTTWVNCALDQLNQKFWLDNGIEKIDYVFHLGAFIPKKSSEMDAVEEIYRDNLLGTRGLLESLPNTPEKIIFSSTIDVYAASSGNGELTEKSPLNPTSLYGASKLFCEHLIKAYSRKTDCGYAILRYGHIYGPGEAAYAKFLPQVIKTLLMNESPVLYGDGSVLRDFMFVGDAIEATVRAAISPNNIEPVNIVSGVSKPIREFAQVLSDIVGFHGKIKYLREKPNGHSLRFDSQRMLDTLGRWDLVTLEDGLRQEVDYFKGLQ